MHKKTSKQAPLWHPKYLFSWLIVFTLYLFSSIPLRTKLWLGAKLGPILAKKMRSRVTIARKNIRTCFPKLDEKQIEQRVVECMSQLAMGALEAPHAWWRDMSRHQGDVTIIGQDHLMKAHAKGKGVLIMGGHFAAVDFIIPLFAAEVVDRVELGYMYRPDNNPVIDRMIVKGRERHKVTGFTKRQLKEMISFIREGGMVWYGCDQDFGKHADLFVPFFGIQAANISTPSWIVRESGATVVFMSMRRLAKCKYEFEFSRELPSFGEDPAKDAAVWNHELEKAIKEQPSQYFWIHRRFKTRPPGEPKFY